MPDFVMPSLGADMDAGTLVAWKKEVGDHVAPGEILAEVETDKGVIAIEAFHAGVLERTLVDVGCRVPVGTKLAFLSEPGVVRADSAAPTAAPKVAATPDAERAPSSSSTPVRVERASEALATVSARALAHANALDVADMVGSGSHGVVTRSDVLHALDVPVRRRITPYARRRARELGVALDDLVVSRAVVVADDVEQAARTQVSRAAPVAASESLPPEQRMRRAIGAAMARSKRDIPHYYVATTIDVDSALSRLAEHNASVPITERVLPAVILLRAATLALRTVPELNALCTGDSAPTIARVDLGVAIALRKGGLVAPPIFDAGDKTPAELMRALDDLVLRARNGRLTASEIRGGTITVTSLGDRGVESLYPIVYPPQVAIVGFGKIVVRPWVVGDAIAPRRVVTATLAADHRFTDGHRGGLYLAAIEAALASPDALFTRDTRGPA